MLPHALDMFNVVIQELGLLILLCLAGNPSSKIAINQLGGIKVAQTSALQHLNVLTMIALLSPTLPSSVSFLLRANPFLVLCAHPLLCIL